MSNFDKLKELAKDKAFIEGLLKNQSAEDARAYLAENGAEMTIDEVKSLGSALGTALKPEGELSESELAAVAGGTDFIDVVYGIRDDIDKGEFELGKEAGRIWDWVKSW